jgi:hypothetical protein
MEDDSFQHLAGMAPAVAIRRDMTILCIQANTSRAEGFSGTSDEGVWRFDPAGA